ncbi:MAG: ABC transporter ATP-binding protein, partial [Rhodospirillales bacterium]|nr:ABC transporter ATP-binding protein [Rhodospirillales bacterium]
YTDMLAQRGAAPAPAPSAAPSPPRRRAEAPARAPAATPAKKLSFKDKHALAALPARIDALHGEIARHAAILADGGLYGRDRTAFARATAALSAAQAELALAEERWLELELLRESVEGS